ncbi:MAG: family 2 glycosyl transferase [candidate division TM6 bacterium GW2011_GWF2_28_16]|nr:MAG: family 2 glycosyl transferase [candidate division TM6 bacterium GW2011_GWF2_28_16]HAZ73055.1 hypothetical protein [Candidatus Paceibacterota bacterium]
MKISVVIVSKNRSNDLTHCLGSLLSQSIVLDQLILIDNNSTDKTKEIFSNFAKNSQIPCKYVLEKRKGYPTVYNRGLKEAKNTWVAFIDDDCVADVDWYESIKKELLSLDINTEIVAILGNSQTYYKNNLFSLLTLFKDKIWKGSKIKKNKVLDFEILDNKNIVYNKNFLIKNKLSFDESRVRFFNGASEDCDLGMQIFEKKGKAKYLPEMLVFHKDPHSSFQFYRKIYFSTLGHIKYEEKWSNFRKNNLAINHDFNFFRFTMSFMNENKLSFLQKVLFAVNLLLMAFLLKGIKFYVKSF